VPTIRRTATHRSRTEFSPPLPAEDYERILPDLKAVPLKYRVSLHEAGDKMPYIYFPSTGVISMLTVMEDGNAVEIATNSAMRVWPICSRTRPGGV